MRLSPQARWNAALVSAAVLALAVVTVRSDERYGIEVERRDAGGAVDEIRVHVSGAVTRPGVVTIIRGERVADAIGRAGGAAADADTAAINLSARLADQDRVVVPRLGEGAALLDLNQATARELERLPGIGPAYATAVVAAREKSGPFAATDDLVTRDVIPVRVYEQIRHLIAVR
jgi:competence protein ComEA